MCEYIHHVPNIPDYSVLHLHAPHLLKIAHLPDINDLLGHIMPSITGTIKKIKSCGIPLKDIGVVPI